MKRMLWIGSLCYLLLGLGHVVIGTVLPELLRTYGRDYSEGGALLFSMLGGFLLGVLFMPVVLKHYNRRILVGLSLALIAAAELAFALMPPWPAWFAIALLAGVGLGSIEAAIGSLVIEAAEPSRKAVAMSQLEVFFGLGALLIPLIAGFMIRWEAWNLTFSVLGVMAVLLTLLWSRISFGGELDKRLSERSAMISSNTNLQERRKPDIQKGLLVLFIAIFLLYVGMEVSLVNFVSSILIERFGSNSEAASIIVTVFWCTMTVGRMLCGPLAERMGYFVYLAISSLSTVIFLSWFAWTDSLWAAYLAVSTAGLGMSGFFGIGLVYANALIPGATEKVTSMLIAAGGIGGALMPLLTGWTMDAAGENAAAWLITGMAGGLTALVCVTRRRRMTVIQVEP
jgi:MFS transporter, FHS family, glucose/mannose:H+ symporter